MGPCLSAEQAANARLADSVDPCDFLLLQASLGCHHPDIPDVAFCELGSRNGLPFDMPILFDHVGYITCLGPEEQVVGVDAARIVTPV